MGSLALSLMCFIIFISSLALKASDLFLIESGSPLILTLNSSYSLFIRLLSLTKSGLLSFLVGSTLRLKYVSGFRGSILCFRQNGTHKSAKLAASAIASKVRSAPPSSDM
uniref:Secreted protein n=1 Tax=Rhizophora mucronata TaxID=61149 RepID=A0A2P2NLK5_RHIMU